MKVITVRNVYTGLTSDLCRDHYDSGSDGDCQVSHGIHESHAGCDKCPQEKREHKERLDVIDELESKNVPQGIWRLFDE